MEYKKMDSNHYVMRIDKDEEVLSKIEEFCKKEDISCGSVVGLGASKYVKIGLYDVGEKKYHSTVLEGPMEITSLIGNISRKDGEVYLHFHINVCNSKMQVYGGHLNECVIGATCELAITVIPGVIERKYDEEIGLNLYKF